MKIGVTGHQRREGADWAWVARHLRAELETIGTRLDGYSSLAAGADQIFAEAVLAVGGRSHAVIPMVGYERRFYDGDVLAAYRSLLGRSITINLESGEPPEKAFLQAGEWIVRHVDRLIAVWDEQPAEGIGGTADVVAFARRQGVELLIINPVARTTTRNAACR